MSDMLLIFSVGVVAGIVLGIPWSSYLLSLNVFAACANFLHYRLARIRHSTKDFLTTNITATITADEEPKSSPHPEKREAQNLPSR